MSGAALCARAPDDEMPSGQKQTSQESTDQLTSSLLPRGACPVVFPSAVWARQQPAPILHHHLTSAPHEPSVPPQAHPGDEASCSPAASPTGAYAGQQGVDPLPQIQIPHGWTVMWTERVQVLLTSSRFYPLGSLRGSAVRTPPRCCLHTYTGPLQKCPFP